MKKLLQPLTRRLRSAEHLVRGKLGLLDSEQKLASDSQHYWSKPETEAQRFNSHWRGQGEFSDDARWLAIGRQHLDLFEQFSRALELKRPLQRIVEWGCGGGANAVHFGPLTSEFVGVDIAQASLDECGRQLASAAPQTRYVPLLLQVENPEAAITALEGRCDLFLCVYVFELLPSPAYARRILRVASQLLSPDGMALIQIKYRTADRRTASRGWNYVRNLAHNTTFGIDEFWMEAEAAGLRPRLLSLMPTQPLLREERYAYFALSQSAGG